MCGIAGYFDCARRTAPVEAVAIVEAMCAALRHRGPDAGGSWVDDECGLAIGHRRLSVIDLSAAGQQPMASACGRFIVSYNGEIYNFLALRQELEKQQAISVGCWRGRSDTEVLLAAVVHWGVEKTLTKLNGMFAFALWDRKLRRLHLSRDRMGEKPLYYGFNNRTFLFGSEIKALRACRDSSLEVNREAVVLLLQHNYIPAPHSIYQGIFKLPPACHLILSLSDLEAGIVPDPVRYWDLAVVAEAGQRTPFQDSAGDLVENLHSLLADAVQQRMVADVPVGAFLSGGIDSSLVVALMQRQSRHPVKTFSLGFGEAAYDESGHARRVAGHLGTDHTEYYVSSKEALAIIPELPDCYDEPFADASQIPTMIISRLARQQVTVSLSGDGGDELFSGYARYRYAEMIWQRIAWMPVGARLGLAAVAATAAASCALMPWNVGGGVGEGRQRTLADRLGKVSECIGAVSGDDFYRRLISLWQNPAEVMARGWETSMLLRENKLLPKVENYRTLLMYLDQIGYLPDDILVKIDRASMACGLEVRVPLLDHRVVEFSWGLPIGMQVKGAQGKRLLRQILTHYIPKDMIERPKMGFGVPLDSWLRGPLREWADSLLNPQSLQRDGILNSEPIRKRWQEHLSGKRNWHNHLWPVLMFQMWMDGNGG